MTSPRPANTNLEPLEEFAANLRRLAAGLSVKPPELPGADWRAFRPGDEVTHPASPKEVAAFLEMTTDQLTMAFALLNLGEPHDAVAYDLLIETAAAAIAFGDSVEAFNGRWFELEQVLTWAGEGMETT